MSYTENVNDEIFGLLDMELSEVYRQLDLMGEECTDAARWEKWLYRLAEKHVLSSRYALMRIFYCRSKGISLGVNSVSPDESLSFADTVNGHDYQFADISMEHASRLKRAELAQYEEYLEDMIAERGIEVLCTEHFLVCCVMGDRNGAKRACAEFMAGEDITKALHPMMTRQRALRLGHLLDLTLGEMQWILMRVFDYEDGFRYNSSEDLTEAYGFLTHSAPKQVDELHGKYRQMAENRQDIVKSESRPGGGETRRAADRLPEYVRQWQEDSQNVPPEQAFLNWLSGQMEYLDMPSASALRIYRGLAAFCYMKLAGERSEADYSEYTELCEQLAQPKCDYMREHMNEIAVHVLERHSVAQAKEAGFRKGKLRDTMSTENKRLEIKSAGIYELASARARETGADITESLHILCDSDSDIQETVREAVCYEIGSRLLRENKEAYASDADLDAAWRTLSVSKAGKKPVTVALAGRMGAERTRIRDILAGRTEVEKGDLLYLIWFSFNMALDGDMEMLEDKCGCLMDFVDICEILLEAALLPRFYPPHMTENCMMLSIVADGFPADNYAAISESMHLAVRQRREGGRQDSE